MSPKTMDRYLLAEIASLNRYTKRGTRRGLRKMIAQIPVRNLGEYPVELGHCEVKSVAHCGDSMFGTFAWTFTLRDFVSFWTECELL